MKSSPFFVDHAHQWSQAAPGTPEFIVQPACHEVTLMGMRPRLRAVAREPAVAAMNQPMSSPARGEEPGNLSAFSRRSTTARGCV